MAPSGAAPKPDPQYRHSLRFEVSRRRRHFQRRHSLGWVAVSGVHELTQLAFSLCSFQFFLLPSSELSQR